jgi:hypothetical protein
MIARFDSGGKTKGKRFIPLPFVFGIVQIDSVQTVNCCNILYVSKRTLFETFFVAHCLIKLT